MCLCDCNLTLFVLGRDDILQSVHDGLNESFFLSDSTGCAYALYRGVQPGVWTGTLINGLTYPVYQYFQFPVQW